MTPILSVEAVQDRSTCVLLDAVAVKPEGAEGGVVSLTVSVKVVMWDRLPDVPVIVIV